jgi:hypothetical protein
MSFASCSFFGIGCQPGQRAYKSKWNNDHPKDEPVTERMPRKKGITLKGSASWTWFDVYDPRAILSPVAARAGSALSVHHPYVLGGSWIEWGRGWTVPFF